MRRQLTALAAIFVVCLLLPSCSSFSNYVSDSWPTWAGGMPRDVPPRPGAPGYEEFIAHQQGNAAAAGTAAVPVTTNTVLPTSAASAPTTAAAQQPMPAVTAYPNAQNVPPPSRRPDDQAAVQGGLY